MPSLEPSRRTILSAVASAAPLLAAPTLALAREGGRVSTDPSIAVVTASGRVRGYEIDGIRTFKGIAYAGDTGGANRFMAPGKVKPWTGERRCFTWGDICPQAGSGGWQSFLSPSNLVSQSEDCLNLNVWTPGLDTRKRPVMVWIHGGQFSAGSSSGSRVCDGEALARRGDVVVVSINHRLNFIGYLDLAAIGAPERFGSATNAGMVDLVAALRWVREHIAEFGGDPANVTLFGQSGGGMKITTLAGMPSAAGLYHKAIVQSGSETEIFGKGMTEPLAAGLLKQLGIAPADAEKLQSVSLPTLFEAAAKATAGWFAGGRGNLWYTVAWAPRVGDAAIPHQPYSKAAAAYSDQVSYLIGSTKQEFAPPDPGLTLDGLRARLAGSYDDPAALVAAAVDLYPDQKPYALAGIISAAQFNRANAVAQARAKARNGGAPAWLYSFEWETPMQDGLPLAYHGAELPFVFANIDTAPTATGAGPRAKALEAKMVDSWVGFARSGTPATRALPGWSPVAPGTAPTMIFDDRCRIENDRDRTLREMAAHKKQGALL